MDKLLHSVRKTKAVREQMLQIDSVQYADRDAQRIEFFTAHRDAGTR